MPRLSLKLNQENQKAYSAEFRGSAVKLATESDQSIAQTAKDLGINVNTLHRTSGRSIYREPPQSGLCRRHHLRSYSGKLAVSINLEYFYPCPKSIKPIVTGKRRTDQLKLSGVQIKKWGFKSTPE